MGAIKNDIFIFRLCGLTRTATVSYYSTQDGAFNGDLASLYCISSNNLLYYICIDRALIGK